MLEAMGGATSIQAGDENVMSAHNFPTSTRVYERVDYIKTKPTADSVSWIISIGVSQELVRNAGYIKKRKKKC